MRFLAIGECMAELAPTDQSGTYRLGFAGDTFNTAWYLARSAPDSNVDYLSAVGDDATSQKMAAFMQQSGIGTTYLQTRAGQTVGLYLISLDQGERSFSYWRGQSAAKGLADDPAVVDDAMAKADFIYFSGITLAILSPERRTSFLSNVAKARAAGKTIAFDPNLRPRLWKSGDEMTQTIMDGARASDIVLPSFEDEADWFNDADPAATADRYLGAGCTTIIVKNGAAPVLYAEGNERGEVAVSPVATLVDSTAAGDAFNAGVFARHAAGDTLANGIAFGCRLSRTVVQAHGALVPFDPAHLLSPA